MNDTRDLLAAMKYLLPGSITNLSMAIALRTQLAIEEKQWHQVTVLESLQRVVDETVVGRYDNRPDVLNLVPRPLPEVAHNPIDSVVGNYRKLETMPICREMKNVSGSVRLEAALSEWEHQPYPNRARA